jgi:hypothetical protein
VDSGAHRRASAGGDDGRGGTALSCARANAREEGVRGARRRLGRLAWARHVAITKVPCGPKKQPFHVTDG